MLKVNFMEKKTLTIIAAIIVVVVVIGAVFAVTLSNNKTTGKVIYWTKVAPGLQKQSISNGTVAGGVSWEPYVSDSVVAGTGKILVNSADVWPNHPCCVIAAKTSWAESGTNAELLARLIKANIVATEWLNKTLADKTSANYTILLQIGASFSGRSTAVVENATADITFITEITQDVKDYLKFYVEQFIKLGVVNDSYLSLRGYSNVTNYINDIVDLSYYDEALTVGESSTILGTVSIGYLAGDLHQFARVIAMNTTLWGGETLFEKYGVKVTTPNVAGFASGGDVMAAFAANAISVAYLGAPPALQQRLLAGTDVKIVSMVNEEGSALVVGDGINSFDDLEGKIVATPGPVSIQHLLFLYLAEQHGYTVKLAGT